MKPTHHPDALGVSKFADSAYVRRLNGGRLSIVRVLRWEGTSAWEANIEALPRGRERPKVWCPFCGRQGSYAHTDRFKYFRHSDGEMECVEGDLESIRHRRGKQVLVAGLRKLREAGLPVRWSRPCDSCEHMDVLELLPAGGWSKEEEECTYRAAPDKQLRIDVGALDVDGMVAALEVRETHAVEGEKLALFGGDGVPMLEFHSRALIRDDGRPGWDGASPLPAPVAWRVAGSESPHRCDSCCRQNPPELAPDNRIRAFTRRAMKHGLCVSRKCVRCGGRAMHQVLAPGAKVQKMRDEPLAFRFVPPGNGKQLPVVLEGEPLSADLTLSLRTDDLPIVERKEERARVLSKAHFVGRPTPPWPLPVCGSCRQPSQVAEELDLLWSAVEGVKDVRHQLRTRVAFELGLPLNMLLQVGQAPFVSVDLSPERAVEEHPWLEPLALKGLRGRLNPMEVAEAILHVDGVTAVWESVSEMLPDPHEQLASALGQAEPVRAQELVVADRVVSALGLDQDSVTRQRAWVLHTLHQRVLSSGSTAWEGGSAKLGNRVWSARKRAYGEAYIRESTSQVGSWVRRLVDDGVLVESRLPGTPLLALPVHLKLAHEFAQLVRPLALSGEVYQGPLSTDLKLDPDQVQAVRVAVGYSLSVVTGGAGTGKTTVIRSVLQSSTQEVWAVAAPTGKAVDRLKQSLGGIENRISCRTVASLISKPERFLNATALVVDEAGFLDLETANKLFRVIASERCSVAKVLLVGDPNQLPSVGPGAVLRDVLACEQIPKVRLRTGHRSGDRIVGFSTELLGGKVRRDLVRIEEVADNQVVNTVLDLIIAQPDGTDVQVVARTRKMVRTLNKRLQAQLNPAGESPGSVQDADNIGLPIRVGDRVICTRNNYDTPATLNGEVGILVGFDDNGFHIRFGGVKRGPFPPERLADFTLAYAITVHKSQGSEWDKVIVAFDDRPMSRAMLYTAATRAKQSLALVGSMDVIEATGGRAARRATVLSRVLPRVLERP